MSNIRTVFDNAIERATLNSNPAGTGVLTVANLANGRKSRPWRVAALLATVNALWPAGAEPIQAVVWPICNWSPTSQMRVRVSTEDTKTNIGRQSENLNVSPWTKIASVINTTAAAAAGVTAPSGGVAHELQEDATAAEHYMVQSIAVATPQQVTVSMFFKAAERGFVVMKFDATENTAAPFASQAGLNLSTGGVSGITAGGWTYTAVSAGGGWWRFIATRTTTAAGNVVPRFVVATSATAISYTGVAGNGVYAWGFMLETGALSSYYPAVSANGVRPAGYIDSWQPYQYDSGLVSATWNAPARKIRGFTAAQAAGAYFNGGGTSAWHWLPTEMQARGLAGTISDPNNLQGYIEAPFLVAGPYWEASYNPTKINTGILDRTTIGYARGGDQWADASDIRRTLDIELSQLAMSDRADMVSMLATSRALPILVSVFPDDPDPAIVRDNMVYGRRPRDSDVSLDTAFTLSMSVPLEEV